jgi:protein-tyrosine phosphatase
MSMGEIFMPCSCGYRSANRKPYTRRFVSPYRILFVCSGNICRSPMAEAIFRRQAAEAGLGERFLLDSAGTHGYHEGDHADPRTRKVARRHGAEVTSIAREIEPEDFENFDLIVAMDRGHLRHLRGMAGRDHTRQVRLMRDFDPRSAGQDVPDPYYSGEAAFEQVYEILDAACRGLLAELRRDAVVP